MLGYQPRELCRGRVCLVEDVNHTYAFERLLLDASTNCGAVMPDASRIVGTMSMM